MDIKPVITLCLFFFLVAGLVVIYHEEIQKMEFFARVQTSPVPKVDGPGNIALPPPPQGLQPPAITIQPIAGPKAVFSQSGGIRFGNGKIVNGRVREVEKTEPGTVLHTITGGVTDYYAEGFLKDAEKLYEPSRYAGYIAFHDRTSGIKSTRPEQEYFVLSVSQNLQHSVEITDWKVFDRSKKISYKLPKGVKVLGTSGTQKGTPIKITGGDAILISSGRSPIGLSFRLNKCSGYRSQFKNFIPSIKTACPDPLDEFLTDGTVPYTDTTCYEVVNRLGTCTAVTNIPSGISNKCRDFLEQVVTERGCVNLHRNDGDFFLPEWRVFLNSKRELWKNENNVLYLLDDENRLVATLVYR